MRLRKFIVIAAAAFILPQCSGGGAGPVGEPPVSEPAFGVAVKEGEVGNILTIRKDVLGEEFLLQSSATPQRSFGKHGSNPTSMGLRSRIVVFEENGDQLIMLESDQNYHPGDEMPAHLLLTAFPIVENNEQDLSFDFNEGMAKVLASWDWYSSDSDGNMAALHPDTAFLAENSYVRSAEVGAEAMTIVQVLTIHQSFSMSQEEYLLPIEITYYLTKYRENPGFVPTRSPGFDYLGYFEANALVQEDFGLPYTYITRWDISKPVTYYLSRDIPEEYRDAVSSGVLYWNKVFGSEVLKAELAPEGITAPDFEHNIIQWHTDNYTGAYSDAQVDPRTGEILHAQIYFSSAFAQIPQIYLAQLERELETDNKSSKEASLTARELQESKLCELKFGEMLSQVRFYRDLFQALPPERIDAMTKDFVRLVVAHEVGHTLGLRHNFAASSVGEWSGEETEENVRNYLENGSLPENIIPPTNSVMEYGVMEDEVIVGSLIAKSGFYLPYDHYAIQWGYFGGGREPEYKGHPFCTDSQISLYDDCDIYDSGKHLVERRAHEVKRSFERLPQHLIEAYLQAKADINPVFRTPVDKSTPQAKSLASAVAGRWRGLVSLLTQDLALSSILHGYSDLSDIDIEELDLKTSAWLNYEIAWAGGVERVLQLINPGYYQRTVESFKSEFDRIVSSEAYQSIPLPEGGTTGFSPEEIDYMRGRAEELFTLVDEELAMSITKSLREVSFKLIDAIEKVEIILAEWAGYVITAGSGLDFRYSIDTRREAALMLFNRGPLPNWLLGYVPYIADELRVHLEEGLGMYLEEVDIKSFPRREQERIADELDIYYALASVHGGRYDYVEPEPAPEPTPSSKGDQALTWIEKLLM